MSELSIGNGEDVAARSVHWTASRKASLRDVEVKSDGMQSGCMSHMIRALLILVLVILAALCEVVVVVNPARDEDGDGSSHRSSVPRQTE